MNYLKSFLEQHAEDPPPEPKRDGRELTKLTKPGSVSFVSSAVSDSGLDQSLACAEVLGFRARLLGDLPVPFSLVCEPLSGGARVTWSVHPRAPVGDETAERWDAIARMRLRERKETVAQLLARLKLKLLLVIIHTEAPR